MLCLAQLASSFPLGFCSSIVIITRFRYVYGLNNVRTVLKVFHHSTASHKGRIRIARLLRHRCKIAVNVFMHLIVHGNGRSLAALLQQLANGVPHDQHCCWYDILTAAIYLWCSSAHSEVDQTIIISRFGVDVSTRAAYTSSHEAGDLGKLHFQVRLVKSRCHSRTYIQ